MAGNKINGTEYLDQTEITRDELRANISPEILQRLEGLAVDAHSRAQEMLDSIKGGELITQTIVVGLANNAPLEKISQALKDTLGVYDQTTDAAYPDEIVLQTAQEILSAATSQPIDHVRRLPIDEVRTELKAIMGIGPEDKFQDFDGSMQKDKILEGLSHIVTAYSAVSNVQTYRDMGCAAILTAVSEAPTDKYLNQILDDVDRANFVTCAVSEAAIEAATEHLSPSPIQGIGAGRDTSRIIE